MKLMINIPNEEYEEILSSENCGLHTLTRAVANGTPVPTDAVDRVTIKEYLSSFEVAQPKVGKWTRELIRNEYGGCIGAKMICSECGQDNGYDKRMKFCPNCGSYNGGGK